jgi:DtxR family transcriptional regulator, Mn-dependent transcriptional regulator
VGQATYNLPMALPSPDLRSLNPASKEYLEAVYELEEEGQRIYQARIGERLGLAPATVSEGVRRLVTEGYVVIRGARDIVLTDSGRVVAETLVRRHRLAERMLTDILEIPWHLCHHQAEDWEKVMTPEVEEAILARLEGEPTCPHGNPIPGAESAIPWSDLESVADMQSAQTATLTRLLEDIELDGDVLRYLEEHALMPGQELTLVDRGPDGTLTLEVNGRRVALGQKLARNLWVLPSTSS